MFTGLKLPPQVIFALELLEKGGYEAYIVGGCVRDVLMDRQPHDYDITTNALPEETVRCFDGCSVKTAHMKHGTVTAAVDGMHIEITTYRVDGSYSDHRRPDDVRFTPRLEEDLARRDFTVNAMAYHPQKGLIDPFGGINDLRARLIRCVGEPEQRFEEDALRIMRAVRFMSVMDFKLEKSASDAVHRLKDKLGAVSAERLAAELTKLLCGQNPFAALCGYYDVLGAFIPELLPCVGFEQHSRYHIYDVWQHTAMAVQKSECGELPRLCAFFHDIGKPCCYSEDEDGSGHFKGHAAISAEMCRDIMRRLRFPEYMVKAVRAVVARHSLEQMNEKSIRRRLNELGEENFFLLLKLQSADNSAKAKFCLSRLDDIEKVRLIAEEIIAEGKCFSLKQLAVNGHDVMAAGYTGRDIGRILQNLLCRVIDGELENKRDILLTAIKRYS